MFRVISFFLGGATPAAYGGSQARGEIIAMATNPHHSQSTVWSDLHHSSQQHWILNPLSEARGQTYILMDTSQISFHWATTPWFLLITEWAWRRCVKWEDSQPTSCEIFCKSGFSSEQNQQDIRTYHWRLNNARIRGDNPPHSLKSACIITLWLVLYICSPASVD